MTNFTFSIGLIFYRIPQGSLSRMMLCPTTCCAGSERKLTARQARRAETI